MKTNQAIPAPVVRLAAFGLLLALVWAAIHPAVINAFPRGAQQVVFCSPTGMAWIDTDSLDYEPIEVALGLSAPKLHNAPNAPATEAEPLIFSCPWCQHAAALESAHSAPQTRLHIYKPWQEYGGVWHTPVHRQALALLHYQLPLNRAPPLA